MNSRIFLLLCCFLTSKHGWTQSVEEVKVLLQKLQVAASPNPKVDLIIQLCDQFSQLNQGDSVKKYIQIAVPLANTLPNETAKIWVDHYLATTLVRTFPDSCFQLNSRCLTYFTQKNDQKGLLKTNHSLGIYHYYHGKPAKERAHYYEALKYAETYYKVYEPKRYPRYRAVMYNNMANSYLDENQYEKALECVLEVEKTARESQSDELHYLAALGLGTIYGKTKQLEKSEFYHREALRFAEKLNKLPYIAVCLNNLGTYYTFTKKNEEAINMFKRALEIAYRMNDWMGAANRLNNLGNIESVKENYKAAESYFLQSIEYADKLKAKKPRLNAMANLARIYVETDRVSEAQKTAQEAIVLAEEVNDRDVLSKLYNTLTKSYEKQKDFSKALVYQQRKAKMQDSILNEKSLAKIQELQIRYETEKKEHQIRELHRLNQIQALEIQERNLWMALFGVSLFGVVLLTAFYARQRILKQQNQVLAINQKLLRTQINPHFFFNVLSSIQAFLLEKQDAAPAVSYLSKFGKLMRSVLENSRVDFIPLSEEITTLQNYLDIQKIRFGDKFDYQIKVENSIEAEEIGIPPMLAQPFLENALEHGIKPLYDKGMIDVLVRPEKDGILLNITDNGIGRVRAAELTSDSGRQSLATQITQERIDVLNRQHKAKIDFIIEDVLNTERQIVGTRVIFHLPLINV
ncbi:MAG: tetratricopeptide repeat protein [Spirosomataceae bacterium]